MRKTFEYRIYPTKAQATRLDHTLGECRWLYNTLLEQRKLYWEEAAISLSRFDQQAYIPFLKAERPSLAAVHSQVLQNVNVRLNLAFEAFYRRVKAGEDDPGYPRFRGKWRYNSFCFPQYGNGVTLNASQLQLAKIGNVRIVLHRPLSGLPKTVTIKRTSTGKWYATISCEVECAALPYAAAVVGIDVGLAQFATLSDGEQIANPRFFRQEQQALATLSRRHSKLVKGSPQRRKHRKALARVHERSAWKRANHAQQHSRRIVNRYQLIAVEELAVENMVQNRKLSKSIHDAAWRQFRDLLTYKAAWAGRQLIAVDAAYTSQDCHNCGHRQKMPLAERIYRCPDCGMSCDRDHNAALNILARGLASIGNQSVEAPGFSHGE